MRSDGQKSRYIAERARESERVRENAASMPEEMHKQNTWTWVCMWDGLSLKDRVSKG